MPLLTKKQQDLVDECIARIKANGNIGKEPSGNLPLGKAVIDQVIIPINNTLVKLPDRNGFVKTNTENLSNDQLFELTRVMMKSYEEASDKDALRSSPVIIAHLYRELANRLKFSPATGNTAQPQMAELHKILYQSLVMTRPIGTLDAAANAIYFTLGLGAKAPPEFVDSLQLIIQGKPAAAKSNNATPPKPMPFFPAKPADRKIAIVTTDQLSMDKINLAENDSAKLLELATKITANLQIAAQQYAEAIKKTSTTNKPQKEIAFREAVTAAKEALQSASYSALIYKKLQKAVPKSAKAYKSFEDISRSATSDWIEKTGEIINKAFKAGVSLSQSQPSTPDPASPTNRRQSK